MSRKHRELWRNVFGAMFLAVASCWPLHLAAQSPQADRSAREQAEQITSAAGIEGGFAVHLGCGEGQLTAALGTNERLTVHGLDRDPAHVAAARRLIATLGLYGRVSAEQLTGNELPYADNLINMVAVSEPAGVPMEEIRRVLAPGGVCCMLSAEGNSWRRVFIKPRPDSIDTWTHFLHDASGNAVAADREVAPPKGFQWVAPPLWLRSHETPSGVQGLTCSGSRLFYIFDEGLIGVTDQRLPERWSLVCLDAFNGRRLWKRSVGGWGWPAWAQDMFAEHDWTEIRGARTVVPDENQRRLVVDEARVYTTLQYVGPLVILDAASGKTLATVPETMPVRQILASDDVVLVYSADSGNADRARRRGEQDAPARLVAVKGNNGEVLWTKPIAPIAGLALAIDRGRVFYQSGSQVACLRLVDGGEQWTAEAPKGRSHTMIAHGERLLLYAQNALAAFDAATGKILWQQQVPPSSGAESPDLFVVDGLVWRGMVPVDENLKAVGKSAHVLAVGYDLDTGEEKRRITVQNLRSPEHHHRCYRNKATLRYIISGMEGAEFLDLVGDDHCQNNWMRGACRLGVMPCNGLLYVPPDQCFCQPGAKLLGFVAATPDRPLRQQHVADDQRLEKGEAYGQLAAGNDQHPGDWPTYRHDAARHGTTGTAVPEKLGLAWRVKLPAPLTQPIAAGEHVYVAAREAHTIYALDRNSGKTVWTYTAGGRIDSPPTWHAGMLLFGSADGRVYCLRASDGKLAWRFLAAPRDCRIGDFDQLASVWPVHGSVLIHQGVAYVTAGRSTYMDGGIRVWGLDPATGAIRHKATLSGPMPEVPERRDFAFYLLGANSDVLAAEGGFLYMRQKKLTAELEEVTVPVLSSKGEQDVGLHVFSTSGLLDGSWYNRAFWMYAKRWPGFQLAQQAPKAGQLLVVDDQNTYAVKVYYRRNVHSPMFFPGREGYLLYADRNTTEPQIVGEPGARNPIPWLPQSHIPREGSPGLDSPAFGLDKMMGYTRAEPPLWTRWLPIRIRAMVKAGDKLFLAGPPDVLDADDPYAAFEGRKGAKLVVVFASDGSTLAEYELDTPPEFDGLIAAGQRLLVSLEDGSLACFAPAESP